MLFGNWEIGEDSIEWSGSSMQQFVIPRENLADIRYTPTGTRFYEWIMAAMEEDWLTQNDLYDLNYAFVYAAGKYDIFLDYVILDATLEEQFEQLEMEDDDEDPD
jgi:hypothetical protein